MELYAVTFRVDFLEEALQLAELLLHLFWDEEQGGFYPYASDGEQLITRTKEVYDGAVPSGNAVAALVLSRLAQLTGEERWQKTAELQFQYLAGAIKESPANHSFTLLALLEKLWPAAELVCTAEETPHELLAFLREKPQPGLAVLIKTPENAARLAALAPFTAEYPCTAGGWYYLCRGQTCSAPVKGIRELKL